MCTVTVLRADGMLRVAFNRDERRDRPYAHPPFIARAGSRRALMPQDPQGRGTWIAANDAGVVLALLNAHAPAPLPGCRSRGLVIPALAGCGSLEDVAYRMETIRAEDFAPFRLLAIDSCDVVEFTRRRRGWQASAQRISSPLLFTSSSLGDAIVEGPRRLLFEQMLATPWDSAAQQAAFHAHRWRDRPAVSVHMSRPDACTVSTTTVEVTAGLVRMIYQPAHDATGTPAGLVIERVYVELAAAGRTRREHAAV